MHKRVNLTSIFCVIAIVVIAIVMFVSSRMKIPYPYIRLSFIDGMTLIFAVIFTYFLLERGNEKRQRKEYCERLIIKIQEQLELEYLKKPTVEKQSIILLTIRSVQKKLKLLANLKKEVDEKDINYAQERFNEYEEFFGEHCQDQNYLASSENTCIRMLTLVSDKLEEIVNKLYK